MVASLEADVLDVLAELVARSGLDQPQRHNLCLCADQVHCARHVDAVLDRDGLNPRQEHAVGNSCPAYACGYCHERRFLDCIGMGGVLQSAYQCGACDDQCGYALEHGALSLARQIWLKPSSCRYGEN